MTEELFFAATGSRTPQEGLLADVRAALTRARAEVLEEAAKIAETVYAKEEMTIRGTGYDIAAHIRAAKGE